MPTKIIVWEDAFGFRHLINLARNRSQSIYGNGVALIVELERGFFIFLEPIEIEDEIGAILRSAESQIM